jgi:hypothetical protein
VAITAGLLGVIRVVGIIFRLFPSEALQNDSKRHLNSNTRYKYDIFKFLNLDEWNNLIPATNNEKVNNLKTCWKVNAISCKVLATRFS